MNSTVYLKKIETPIGAMIAGATDEGICLLEFENRKMLPLELKQLSKELGAAILEGENQHFKQLEAELKDYFMGKLKEFNVPLALIGSEFQKKVWRVLLTIPYGKTRSYKEQAITIGNADAVRAVAHANGMNKISIIIPCHRVIGSNGQLVGYGGGLWRKKYLLGLEQNNGKQLKLIELDSE